MAVRQYIGARYVAKIYVNSQDSSSADWESGFAYEPLTMVTYNSSSYISRKAVAASVGNPADNPEYWAVTGLYNGQIAQLQNDVNALEAQNGSETLTTTAQTLSSAINELDSFQTIATAVHDGTKTYSDLLSEIKTAFDALPSDQKFKCKLKIGNGIYVISNILGVFSFNMVQNYTTTVSGTAWIVSSPCTFFRTSNGTITEETNTVSTEDIKLLRF